MSYDVQLGVVAAMSAVADSGIIPALGKGTAGTVPDSGTVPMSGTVPGRVDPTRLGISFGCGNISSDPEELASSYAAGVKDNAVDYRAIGAEVMKGLTPLWLLKYLPNMPACHVSIFVDAQGPNNSLTTGDAASLEAIGEAFRVIRRGWADVMIAGGVDAKVNPINLIRYRLLGWANMNDGAPETLARPFDKARAGFVVGEGAASLILEELHHARARGAKIYGEVLGFGGGCDATGLNEPHPDGRGCRIAMTAALRDAKTAPADVDAIFANASGAVVGDRAEARAIASVFGPYVAHPPSGVSSSSSTQPRAAGRQTPPLVTATRSMIGHVSAGGGALDAVAALSAIEAGAIPPTLNCDAPDPECPVNVMKRTPLSVANLDRILINNGGFGGQFASLVIGRYSS
jgi:3-oxoacyl-[acyl-carrier-protein] synthase II